MPSTIIRLLYGIIGGLVGAVAMAIIMMAMGSKVKTSPPAIMAQWLFGDEEKKPLVLMPVMAMWGLVFALLTSTGVLQPNYAGGIIIAAIAWITLNVVMLPIAGAGLFGMKRRAVIPFFSAMMHIIWGIVAVFGFNILTTLLG